MPGWPTVQGAVWVGSTSTRVPETFVATSHEWTRIFDYGGPNTAAWQEIFRLLSPSPVIRVGGASQDSMTSEPGPEVWEALKKLRSGVNARCARAVQQQHCLT